MTAVADTRGAPVRSGVRTAWRVAASLAAAGLLLWGTAQALSVLAHQERTFTETFATEGIRTLDIDVASGSAEVVAGDVDEITVTARVSEGLRPTGHEQVIAGDRLVLSGTCPLFLSVFCTVDYDVVVPRDLEVEAHVGDGTLRIVGTEGTVVGSTDNGAIELEATRGDLRLDSDNGSIRGADLVARTAEVTTDNGGVALGFAEPPTAVTADSDNGSVEVRLPTVAGSYRVETDTDNGAVQVAVATDPGSSRLVRVTSDNGDLRVLPEGGAG